MWYALSSQVNLIVSICHLLARRNDGVDEVWRGDAELLLSKLLKHFLTMMHRLSDERKVCTLT